MAQLLSRADARRRVLSRFRTYRHDFAPDPETGISPADAERLGIEHVEPNYLDDEERAWGRHEPRAQVVERFRRRLAVSEASIARFVIGGARKPNDSRPSGIVEEAVLSLALARPIYLAGGFGGAAADLGVVLGLAEVRTGVIPDALKDHLSDQFRGALTAIAGRLRPPPLTALPVFPDEQVDFLRKHALGGPGWPDNGLSVQDNRALFRSRVPEEVAALVVRGLVELFKDR